MCSVLIRTCNVRGQGLKYYSLSLSVQPPPLSSPLFSSPFLSSLFLFLPASDVHCSLEIIKALILSSKAHLNIFSKNVVVILDTLLVDISDFDIVRHCQTVFSCFCAAHDGSTLGIDLEFRTLYDRVVARFADIAVLAGDGTNRYYWTASASNTSSYHGSTLLLTPPPFDR